MRTIVYIDGLNFYYGATKKTNLKWVNVRDLVADILDSKHQIIKVKLFTANVKPTPADPNVNKRQSAYFRALKNQIPELEIHYGHFSEHITNMPLANPKGKKRFEDVIKREEKGSDVNLAVHFLNDAWQDNYDCGVVVSNDSDLAEAMKLVKQQTDKLIGLISPYNSISKELSQHSHFQRKIRQSALKRCQMPHNIPDTNITIPYSWR